MLGLDDVVGSDDELVSEEEELVSDDDRKIAATTRSTDVEEDSDDDENEGSVDGEVNQAATRYASFSTADWIAFFDYKTKNVTAKSLVDDLVGELGGITNLVPLLVGTQGVFLPGNAGLSKDVLAQIHRHIMEFGLKRPCPKEASMSKPGFIKVLKDFMRHCDG